MNQPFEQTSIASAAAQAFPAGATMATALPASFDIAGFEDVQSGTVAIRDPLTGAPTALVIEIAGPEHPLRRRDSFDRQRRVRQDIMKSGKVQLDDPEEEEQEQIDKIARYTLGWSGLTIGGQAVPYSRQAAQQLYSDPKRRWLRDQVRAALDERERFIKRSASN
jgi:hypothetical protein